MWQKLTPDFQEFYNFLKIINCLNSKLFFLGILALSENVDPVLETSKYLLFDYVYYIFVLCYFFNIESIGHTTRQLSKVYSFENLALDQHGNGPRTVYIFKVYSSLHFSLRFTVLMIQSSYWGFRSSFFGDLLRSNAVIFFWSS